MIEAVAGIPEGYPDNQLEQEYSISIRLGIDVQDDKICNPKHARMDQY